ncbi:hypothetical protein D3C80_1964690 [compost metagenome]
MVLLTLFNLLNNLLLKLCWILRTIIHVDFHKVLEIGLGCRSWYQTLSNLELLLSFTLESLLCFESLSLACSHHQGHNNRLIQVLIQ